MIRVTGQGLGGRVLNAGGMHRCHALLPAPTSILDRGAAGVSRCRPVVGAGRPCCSPRPFGSGEGPGPGARPSLFYVVLYCSLTIYHIVFARAAAPSLSFKLAACAASTGRRGVSIRHRGGPSRGRIAMRSHGSPQYYHRFIARGNGALSTVVSRPPSSVSPCPCRRRIGRPNVPAVRPVSLPELSLVAIPPLPS